MKYNVFKALLIAGVCLPLGIVQCFSAPAGSEIQLEKEYEQQLKRDEDLKKANPEIYNKLKQQAQKARLNAYQKAGYCMNRILSNATQLKRVRRLRLL